MVFFLFFLLIGLLGAGYSLSLKILSLMTAYLKSIFNVAVISLAPQDIILTVFKIDLILVSIVLLPVILTWIVFYISPALYEKEKKMLYYIPPMLILAILGIGFGWIMSIKVFIPYLQSFSKLVNIPNNWSIVNLISFVLTMCSIFLVIFQLPLLISALVKLNILKIEQLTKIRKGIILIAVFFGAIVTPPDVVSQLIVALPFYLLFEVTIQFLKLSRRFKK